MSSSAVGTVVIDVKADTAKLVSGMKRAESTVSKSVSSMKKAVLGMAVAYAGLQGVKALSNLVTDSIDAADATGKLAKKLGTTTEALSKYQYAASFAGVSTGELNAGLSAMIRRLNNFQRDGGGAAAKAMETLGISAEYARENMTSTDEAFKEIMKRLSAMPDGYKKTAVAQDIFSKSAANLINLTASDMERLGLQAEETGHVITASAADMAAKYNDSVNLMNQRLSGIVQQMALSILPSFNNSAKALDETLSSLIENKDEIASLGKEAVILGASLGMVLVSVKAYPTALAASKVATELLAISTTSLGRTMVVSTVATKAASLAMNAMPLVAIASATMALYKAISYTNEAYERQAEILKKQKEASEGYTGLGILEDHRYEEMTKQLALAYDKMVGLGRAYNAVQGTASETYIKAQLEKAKKGYADQEKALLAYSKKVFAIKDKISKTPKPKGSTTTTNTGTHNVLGATSIIDLSLDANTQNVICQYEAALGSITNDLDKINNRYGAMYDVVKDLFSAEQLEDFYAVWGKEIDDITKKNEKAIDGISDNSGKGNEKVRGIFEDWSDQISKTLADGIQAGLDGTDFSDFAYSLTESIGNSMTQAGLNSISSTLTKGDSTWSDVSTGDWVTTAIGIVLMGITSAQEKSSAAEQNLSNSMDKLTAVNKQLADINKGAGTKMSDTFGQYNSLMWDLDSATSKLEDFSPTLWQEANDTGASGFTNDVKDLFNNAGITSFDSALDTQASLQGELDKYVSDWFGSDTDRDNLKAKINEAKTALGEWSIEVSNSMDALISYGEKFGTLYDKLTGTNTFSDASGKAALDKVTSTFGMDLESLTKLLGTSLNISNIDELKAGLALGDQSQQNIDAMKTVSELFRSIGVSSVSAVDAINMFDDIEKATDYQIKLNKELADSYKTSQKATEDALKASLRAEESTLNATQKSLKDIEDALRAVDSAYLGKLSYLSRVEKTDYANNAAYLAAPAGGKNAVDTAYAALENAYASATKQGDYIDEFNRYIMLQKDQAKGSSLSDVVAMQKKGNDILQDVRDRVERIEERAS